MVDLPDPRRPLLRVARAIEAAIGQHAADLGHRQAGGQRLGRQAGQRQKGGIDEAQPPRRIDGHDADRQPPEQRQGVCRR
ncbi:hypothetical protein RQ744_20370, partial [Roseomonas mucosa]